MLEVRSASAAGWLGPAGATPPPVGAARRTTGVVRRAVWLAITAISLYLVAPAVVEVLGSAGDVARLDPLWLAAMLPLQGASLACMWWLQRTAIRARGWEPVVTSQLAGNAIAKVAPGGGAVGAALQYRMLVERGAARGPVVAGLTASNLLVFAAVLALPVVALPSVLHGAVHRGLVEATLAGVAVFAVLAAAGAWCVVSDRPLHAAAAVAERLRGREPGTLDARLLAERDRILITLGEQWRPALAATVGRWAFDYMTLLAALAAVGSSPRPVLVLMAFCTAQVLAQVPLTPGGLGFVEAGLTATLTLAGVGPADAVLATFAYRLFSYWLALPLGLGGYVLHRRRLRAPAA